MPPVADGPNTPGEPRGEQERFFSAAKRVAGLTMLSRVLGLLRDLILIPLGSPVIADAFWTAFGIPHLFRRLFGEGALSAAFIPVFTESAETEGWDRARKVLGNAAGWLATVLAGLVVVIELGLLVWLAAAPGAPKTRLTLQYTLLMLPFTFFICMLALFSAALNSRGHFAYPAAAPILLNVGLIAAGWWIAPALGRTDAEQLAIVGGTVVLCSVVQFVGGLLMLRRTHLAVRWTLRPLLGEIRQIARRMGPTVVPLGMMQLCDLFARLIALAFTRSASQTDLPLAPGVIRCHYAAGRLYQLPLGVLAISLATVVFPLLSRCAARRDEAALRDVLNRALRLCLFLGIPAGVALILLAEPTIAVFWQRRDFTALDTARTAGMLRAYCVAMPAYFAVHILLRAFFALKDTRTPMFTSAGLAVLNVLLVFVGIFTPLRSAALGAATAVASTLNALILTWVLRRRLGRLGLRRVLGSAARVAVATAAMGFAIGGILASPLAGRAGLLPAVIAAVLAGGFVFLGAARAVGCPELGILLRRSGRNTEGDSATMS